MAPATAPTDIPPITTNAFEVKVKSLDPGSVKAAPKVIPPANDPKKAPELIFLFPLYVHTDFRLTLMEL